MTEFEKEIALIEKMGLKTSPLRLEYEKKVHELRSMPEKLKAEGYTEDQIARVIIKNDYIGNGYHVKHEINKLRFYYDLKDVEE